MCTAATDENNDPVVIKLINNKKTITEHRFAKELAEMQQEYDMLQKCRHSFAVNKVLDFKVSAAEYAYLVLEFIEGKSVEKFINEANPITLYNCLQLTESILKAFSSLHQCGLIHGDIHSSNVLVNNVNKVRIIDLGFTQSADANNNEVVTWGGVYHYMPPENQYNLLWQIFKRS